MSTAVRRPKPETLRELEVRAAALAGRSVGEVAAALAMPLPDAPGRHKGFVGQLLEHALGADADAGDGPDFAGLGVELKTVPLGASSRPIESTFVCSIGMAGADREQWQTSRLCRRLSRVLFVPVEGVTRAPLGDRRFLEAVLWSPSEVELAALRADWEDLIGRIGAGVEVTAHEGVALQVRPKAANSRVRTLGTGGDGPRRRLPLGFYLRASFTAMILARR